MNYFKHDKAIVGDEAVIGEDTRIWANTNVQSGAVIGKGCNISDGCFIENGAVIGDFATVKHNVSVFDGVTLEAGVFIGSNVAFINDRYPRSQNDGQWQLEKTHVGQGATIGSNTTIMCGLTVGAYAMIGSGSVVTKNVPAHAIIHGNPGVQKGYACRCGKPLDDQLKCSCKKSYSPEGQGLKINE